MRVSRLGDSLAVLLPDTIVTVLGLSEGDEVDVELAGEHGLAVSRSVSRADAVEVLRALSRPAPHGFRFDRDEANGRGS